MAMVQQFVHSFRPCGLFFECVWQQLWWNCQNNGFYHFGGNAFSDSDVYSFCMQLSDLFDYIRSAVCFGDSSVILGHTVNFTSFPITSDLFLIAIGRHLAFDVLRTLKCTNSVVDGPYLNKQTSKFVQHNIQSKLLTFFPLIIPIFAE